MTRIAKQIVPMAKSSSYDRLIKFCKLKSIENSLASLTCEILHNQDPL